MIAGQKHLIECHCVLALYKNKEPPLYHRFVVYSKFKDTGEIIPKYVNCYNCWITHFVYEICKSDIKVGNEEVGSIRTIQDISLGLPDKISKILSEHNATIDLYEEIEDIIDNDLYPAEVVIKRDIIDEKYHFKILKIENINKIKILSESIQDMIIKQR